MVFQFLDRMHLLGPNINPSLSLSLSRLLKCKEGIADLGIVDFEGFERLRLRLRLLNDGSWTFWEGEEGEEKIEGNACFLPGFHGFSSLWLRRRDNTTDLKYKNGRSLKMPRESQGRPLFEIILKIKNSSTVQNFLTSINVWKIFSWTRSYFYSWFFYLFIVVLANYSWETFILIVMSY